MQQTTPRPHASWCTQQNVEHAVCHHLVAVVEVVDGLRLIVDLNTVGGVTPLISLTVDRRGSRHLVPLTDRTVRELAVALQAALDLIDGKA